MIQKERVEYIAGATGFQFRRSGIILRRYLKRGYAFVKFDDGGDIKKVSLSDLITPGQMLISDLIATPKTVAEGQSAEFSPNSLGPSLLRS